MGATVVRVLFAVIAINAAARGQNLSSSEIKALLEQVRVRRASAPDVQADFREEKTLHLLAKPIVSSGRVWFEAPNKFRREVKGNAPSLTASDGHQLWIYYPNFKSAEHYSLGKHSPVDAAIAAVNTALNLDNVENAFQITAIKVKDGYDLQLLPRSSSMKHLFERFDVRLSADLLAERTEMLQGNGDRIVTTYSNQSRASIPPETFAFTPPAGTDVTAPLGR